MIRVGDIDIAYDVTGDAYPLVMIMGYGASRYFWEKATIKRLAEDFKVITFDNRGIGETGRGSQPFSMSLFAEDVFGLMSTLGIEKAHVLGWSMGSVIAQELALAHPETVNGLILYSTLCEKDMFPADSMVIDGLQDRSLDAQERSMRWVQALFPGEWILGNMDRIKEIFQRSTGDVSREGLEAQALAMLGWKGSRDRLTDLPPSTLLVTGDEDILTPWANSRYMASRMTDPRLEVIKGTGHGLMFQEPEKFLSIIRDYLQGKKSE